MIIRWAIAVAVVLLLVAVCVGCVVLLQSGAAS